MPMPNFCTPSMGACIDRRPWDVWFLVRFTDDLLSSFLVCLVNFFKAKAKLYFKVSFVKVKPILSYQNFASFVEYFDQRLGAEHSKCWSKFGNLLKFFGTKNIETAYFNQCLKCTAPKHWSKYTTLLALLLALICWKLLRQK